MAPFWNKPELQEQKCANGELWKIELETKL